MNFDWAHWNSIYVASNLDTNTVYKIRIISKGIPITIGRFLGVDKQGLLCIGTSSHMERRRKKFIQGITKGRGHSEANLLHLIRRYTEIDNIFPEFELEYSFIQINYEEEAKILEETLIKVYVSRFGEVPPLNSAIPGRYDLGTWELAQIDKIDGAI